MAIHPETQAALDNATAVRHKIDDMFERISRIRARRPSPRNWVIPEIDGAGRLTDLYIAQGTIARLSDEQLAAEIMAAIRESTTDAKRHQSMVIEKTVADDILRSGLLKDGADNETGW
jgi:DNA-binding protein YbaB